MAASARPMHQREGTFHETNHRVTRVRPLLDDSVTQYLPFFRVKYPAAQSPDGTSKVITIRNLLNHSSGLADRGFRIMGWIHHDGEPAVNQTALVEKVLPGFSELGFEPARLALSEVVISG